MYVELPVSSLLAVACSPKLGIHLFIHSFVYSPHIYQVPTMCWAPF